jgi:hypothetical protein
VRFYFLHTLSSHVHFWERNQIYYLDEEKNYELSKKDTIITFKNIFKESYRATLEFMTGRDEIIIGRPEKIR